VHKIQFVRQKIINVTSVEIFGSLCPIKLTTTIQHEYGINLVPNEIFALTNLTPYTRSKVKYISP
jgi:hypothetical protein